MYDFADCIQNEIDSIKFLLHHYQYDKNLNGTLVLNVSKDGFHYSRQIKHIVKGQSITEKIPLGDQNNKEVIAFKRNRYNKELRKKLRHNLALLEKLKAQYEEYDPVSIYREMPVSYRDIPTKLPEAFVPKELKAWALQQYATNPKEFSDLANLTANCVKTRSKGEVILYNILDFYGIPYRTEVKLKLIDRDGHILFRYPDAEIPTISGRPIWWEHHGKLNDDDYMGSYLEKSELYYRNGLYLGDNLIVTVDRPNSSINAFMIHQIVRYIVLPQVQVSV